MSELLNGFFSSVFTRESPGEAPEPVNMGSNTQLGDLTISAHLVQKKIRALRKNAAAGPDEIGPRLLQELIHEVSGPLASIFRASVD
jgi:hypothetical protein